MQATLKIREKRATTCEMTESKTPKNLALNVVKKSVETPSPTKEDSSMDEWSSVKSWTSSSYTDDSIYLCASCRRKKFESRSETSSGDEYDSSDTYNISEGDPFDTSDTTSGSGYISMDGSSSMDDSRRISEEGSGTSCYYCDRSASSSSSSDTNDFYSESLIEDDSNFTSLSEREFQRECFNEEADFLEIEE